MLKILGSEAQYLQNMSITEIMILRWMCSYAIKDKIRHETICNKIRVVCVEDKMYKT